MTSNDDRPTIQQPAGDEPTAEQTAVQQPTAEQTATAQPPTEPSAAAPASAPARFSATRRVVAGAGVGLLLVGGLVGFGIGHATAGGDDHRRDVGRGGYGQFGPRGDGNQQGPGRQGGPGQGPMGQGQPGQNQQGQMPQPPQQDQSQQEGATSGT